jgi:hypothetical protein
MPAGPNLTVEELQQLLDLLTALQNSHEFEELNTAEDADALSGTTTFVNYVRVSRPEDG